MPSMRDAHPAARSGAERAIDVLVSALSDEPARRLSAFHKNVVAVFRRTDAGPAEFRL